MNFILTILSIISLNSKADEFIIKYGPGYLHSNNAELTSLGYQNKLHNAIYQKIEGGAWVDNASGMSNSLYISYSLGLRVDSGKAFAEWFFGPTLISSPDNNLGGTFQFNHDLFFGLRDKQGYSVGLGIKHISSAGIEIPNLGRDFILIRIGVPL